MRESAETVQKTSWESRMRESTVQRGCSPGGGVEGGRGKCTVSQCTCATRLNAFQLVGIPHRATPYATHASHPPYDAWVACVTAAICFKTHTNIALLMRRRRRKRKKHKDKGRGANCKTQMWEAIHPMYSCPRGMQNNSKTHTYISVHSIRYIYIYICI